MFQFVRFPFLMLPLLLMSAISPMHSEKRCTGIPDEFPIAWKVVDFTGQCRHHDSCYCDVDIFRQGSYARCDDAMLDELKRKCNREFKGTAGEVGRQQCYQVAVMIVSALKAIPDDCKVGEKCSELGHRENSTRQTASWCPRVPE